MHMFLHTHCFLLNTCPPYSSIIIETQSAVQLAGITLWADFLSNYSLQIASSSNPHNHISFVPLFCISHSRGLTLYSHFCSFYSAPRALPYRLNNPIDIGRLFWKLQGCVDVQSLEACLIISAVIVVNCGAVGPHSPHLLSAGCFTGGKKYLCSTKWDCNFLPHVVYKSFCFAF